MTEIDYNALTKALSSRRFLPQVFDTAAEAKAAALEIIGTKSVGIGGSATVRDMKLAEALQENGNEVYWHWLVAKEAKQAARDKALMADVYMCSTNALTADGRLVNIDGTGNRSTASSGRPVPPTPGGWASIPPAQRRTSATTAAPPPACAT